ncbi:serine hydrolase domain-containing protein [Actinokineospora pegani]|uniref:serine hydrolase domain-containing protein n=1 Tax=Actinokineospora pegani TaxID=2654637 RepID=UPI0012EA131F|nr:serine hydrolase domain-containing protein [Actinokineospora pegani]
MRLIEDWPVDNAAAAVVRGGEVVDSHGDQGRRYPLASVTKPLSAYAVLIAVEEGALEWDQPAGPEGATVRHLIAHTAGYAFDSRAVQAAPGARRIYSNAGFAVLADTLAEASGIAFADYLAEAVFAPLGMTDSALEGPAGSGAVSTAADLARFAAELQNPTLVSAGLVAEATQVVFPDRDGVLPGYGSQKPNDWGLGFEIKDGKAPHWTAEGNSPRTFGHFGQSGTFLWVDPQAGLACAALSDRAFGPWAIEAWPPFSQAVLDDNPA